MGVGVSPEETFCWGDLTDADGIAAGLRPVGRNGNIVEAFPSIADSRYGGNRPTAPFKCISGRPLIAVTAGKANRTLEFGQDVVLEGQSPWRQVVPAAQLRFGLVEREAFGRDLPDVSEKLELQLKRLVDSDHRWGHNKKT